MFRIALIDLVMFSLPFVLYGVYMLTVRGAVPGSVWQGAPVLWLLIAGSALLLITMATLISFSGGRPGGTYHPPRIEDGVVKQINLETKPGTVEESGGEKLLSQL